MLASAGSVRQVEQVAGRARFRAVASRIAAWLLAALFLVSGLWKLSDLPSAAERMVQSLVPVQMSMAAAVIAGTAEVFTAICLLLPWLRRIGGWLAALMLVVFMVYIGVFYQRLIGDECNCFPWIRRVVGPGFFIGDSAMLVLAVVAAWGAERARGIRSAAVVATVVCGLALAGFIFSSSRHSGVMAPLSITVEGRAQNLHRGRVMLFFYDPACSHCLRVAKQMSQWDWGSTALIALPTAQPESAKYFLSDSGLRMARTSLDAAVLRKTFLFTDPPFGVALISGRQAAAFHSGELDTAAFPDAMQRLGFIAAESR